MKYLFYIDHFLHDLGLTDISRNAVQHERVDVRLKFMRFHCRIDCLSPKLHCDMIGNQLAFTRIFKECFADLRAGVDGAEYVATGAMIKARDRP